MSFRSACDLLGRTRERERRREWPRRTAVPHFHFSPLALEGILVLSVSADDEPGSRGVRGLWCAHRVDGLACNEMQINIFIDPREYGCRGEEEEEADVWRAEEEDGLKKGIPRRDTRPSGNHVGTGTRGPGAQELHWSSPWFHPQARRSEPQPPLPVCPPLPTMNQPRRGKKSPSHA